MPSKEAVGVMRRGVAAYQQGRLDQAEAKLSRAMGMFSPWKTASGYRAIVRMELGDEIGARTDAELASKLSPNDAKSFTARGFGRLILGDTAGAAKDFTYATRNNKRFVPAYLGMAALSRAGGDTHDALANIGIALKSDSSAGMAYTMRGSVYERAGRTEEALRAYTAAIAMGPDAWRSRLPRARLFLELDRTRDAVDDLNRYLERDKHSSDALLLRGQARFKAGDYQGAAVDLDKTLGVDPTNGVALANRGLARSALGDNKGALSDLRQAMALAPSKRAQIQPQLEKVETALGIRQGRADGYDNDRPAGLFAAIGKKLRGGRNKPKVARRPRRERANVRYEYEASPTTARQPLFAKAWNRPARPATADLRDSLNTRTYSKYRDSGGEYRGNSTTNNLSSFKSRRSAPRERRQAAPVARRDSQRAAISASIMRRHGYQSASYDRARYSDFPDARRDLRDSVSERAYDAPRYDEYEDLAYDAAPRSFIERLGAIVRGRAAGVQPYSSDGYEKEESRFKKFAREFWTPAPKEEEFIYHRDSREAKPRNNKTGDWEESSEWEMPYRNPAEEGNSVYEAMGRPAPRPARRVAPRIAREELRDAPAPLPTNVIRRAPRRRAAYRQQPRYETERGYQRRLQEKYYSDAPRRRTRAIARPRRAPSRVAEYHRKRRRERPAKPVLIY